MRDIGVQVDDRTVYGIFVAALLSECDLEIQEFSREKVFDREEVMNIVQAQFELLRKNYKRSSSVLSLIHI